MATVTTTQTGWRVARDRIAERKRTLEAKAHKMDQFTRETIAEDIKAQIETSFPVIANGQLSEWRKSIKNYMDASAGIDAEYSKEINRWDSAKLVNELNAARAFVEMAGRSKSNDLTGSSNTSKRLGELYIEAKNSGDIYKQRAVYETLRSIDPDHLPRADRLPAAVIRRQAEEDLTALRVTLGMVKAKEAQAEAWKNILNTREEMIETAKTLGEYDKTGMFPISDFDKALRMVQIDRTSGEVMIYPEDSVEVNGFDMSKMMLKT
jgi:hypothetical protein